MKAETGGRPKVGEAQICGVLEHVAGIHEHHTRNRPEQRDPQLAVQQNLSVAASGKP